MPTIFVKDSLRQAVEAATGGKVTVLYSADNSPGYYCVVPKFNLQDIDVSLGTGAHPAFIVDGVEKSEIFIGQFQGVVRNGMLLSLPNQVPDQITFGNALTYCAALGPGFHLMTNAEWSAIALWCWKNGFQPHGNNNYGKDYTFGYEVGRRGDGLAPGTVTIPAFTLTGSGPVSWRHNNDVSGIADLNGNGDEHLGGLRLNAGEIQIIKDNDAAVNTFDQSSASTLWKAISSSDGSLVAPGTAGTLKFDASAPVTGNGLQGAILSDGVTNATNPSGNDYRTRDVFSAMGIKEGLTAPAITKILGIYPVTNSGLGSDALFMKNHGERMAVAGGSSGMIDGAGVFSKGLYYDRATGVALARPAFVI